MNFTYETETIVHEATKHARTQLYTRLNEILLKVPAYIRLPLNFLDLQLSYVPNIPDYLIEPARQYDVDAAALNRDTRYCKQVLSTLAIHCELEQDLADALPDCVLRDVLPTYWGYTRILLPYEIFADNPRMQKQVEKAVDILRTYQMLKLIEGD